MKKQLLLSLTFLLPIAVLAQDQPPVVNQSNNSGNIYMEINIIVFIITALIILVAALSMLTAFKAIAQEMINPTPYLPPQPVQPKEFSEWKTAKSDAPGIWTKILGLKPLSDEKDIMMEHQFDGISELDNPTPAWFMWLFYSTIAFAFIYMVYFHVLGYGLMQEEEYEIEMVAAQAERKIFLASSSNNIDESSVKVSTDAETMNAGKSVFAANCVACHGDKGQGSVGPNLTDEYWLHGGTVGSLFKTIKYGVPEKGMISWEKMLTPKQISDVSNYILSLKGTNPPNGKAPQGDKEG